MLGNTGLGAEIDLAGGLILRPRPIATVKHKSSIALLGMPHPFTNLAKNPVDRQPLGNRRLSHRHAIAAPRPEPWVSYPLRPHRIQHHVATQFEQMRSLFHQNGCEPSLEQVTHPRMLPNETIRGQVCGARNGGWLRARRFRLGWRLPTQTRSPPVRKLSRLGREPREGWSRQIAHAFCAVCERHGRGQVPTVL